MKIARVPILSLFFLLFVHSIAFSRDIVKVARVIDGDTIELTNGEKVRLIGVDTPETLDPSKPVGGYGREAAEFVKERLQDQTVRLEYDWQQRDKYGRLLAYVFLEDGTFFNATLIEEGYAHAYTKYPFKQEYMDQFRDLERKAREAKRGLWADEGTAATLISGAEKGNGKYWLNTASNVLHNAACKWYGNTSKGRYTDDVEGKDCGICGGAKAERKVETPGQGSVKYWINSSSNTRHNSSCRWYGTTKKGYYTTKKEGKACGQCGG